MVNTLIKLLKSFPDKPWDYGGLSCNPNITFDFVLANFDKPWYWGKKNKKRIIFDCKRN